MQSLEEQQQGHHGGVEEPVKEHLELSYRRPFNHNRQESGVECGRT